MENLTPAQTSVLTFARNSSPNWTYYIETAKAKIAKLKAAGATKGQLAHLRREMYGCKGALRLARNAT